MFPLFPVSIPIFTLEIDPTGSDNPNVTAVVLNWLEFIIIGDFLINKPPLYVTLLKKLLGITIHLVNEKYDEGKILFQKSTPILDNDDVASLSSRIHNLEYKYYPQIIEKYLLNQL